jgi:peroxiredoxin family protein
MFLQDPAASGATAPGPALDVDAVPDERKVAIICSKGGLDEVYPALILANGARQAGIKAFIFFTFWGLDAITEKKVDSLKVNMTGNAASPMPPMLTGLPGMSAMAASMMGKKLSSLEIPAARDMLKMLDDMGCELYACELAMSFMDLGEDDLIPEVKGVLTVGDFYDLTDGAQIIFT